MYFYSFHELMCENLKIVWSGSGGYDQLVVPLNAQGDPAKEAAGESYQAKGKRSIDRLPQGEPLREKMVLPRENG